MKLNLFFKTLLLVVLLTDIAESAVRPKMTRIISYTSDKETQVDIINDSTESYMVQSWIEDTEGRDTDIPLILTPPVMKLEGKQQGKLRIVTMPGALPTDRESVYWLAVQEIPPKVNTDENHLIVAIRSRVKLFVRPDGFDAAGSKTAAKNLRWSIIQESGKKWLKATNATPYYISLNDLSVSQGQLKGKNIRDVHQMVPPHGSEKYALPTEIKTGKIAVTWDAMTDWGGPSEVFKGTTE